MSVSAPRQFTVCVGTGPQGVHGPHDPIEKVLDYRTVKSLTNDELTNALFYSGFSKYADDYAQTMLRREQLARWVAEGDTDNVQRLLADVVFEAVGGLFENADHRGVGITAYDSEGFGVELALDKVYVGQVAD